MDLINKLKECATIGQADPIMSQLNLTDSQKKLVETSIILNNSPDPQQRSHAFKFMDTVIKELESGSHQSSHQRSPYPNPAFQSNNGENSMMHVQGTENSWNGHGVDTDKAMQFMENLTKQFLNHYHNNHKSKLDNRVEHKINETGRQIIKNNKIINVADQRIKELENEVKETKTNMRKEIIEFSSIQGIKETVPLVWNEPVSKFKLPQIRNAINQMDKMISGNGNPEFMFQKV